MWEYIEKSSPRPRPAQALLALLGLVVVLAAVWWTFEPAQSTNATQVRHIVVKRVGSALLCFDQTLFCFRVSLGQ